MSSVTSLGDDSDAKAKGQFRWLGTSSWTRSFAWKSVFPDLALEPLAGQLQIDRGKPPRLDAW